MGSGFNGTVEGNLQNCVFRGFQQGFEQVLVSRFMGDQYLRLFQNVVSVRFAEGVIVSRGREVVEPAGKSMLHKCLQQLHIRL